VIRESQINQILTPDQQKKWEEMKKQARERKGKREQAPPSKVTRTYLAPSKLGFV
jgi:Spy/CpxP family protein refolding chaperone